MTERIITSLSEIDEMHLILYQRKKNDYQRSKRIIRRWISIAAVLVLILGGTLLVQIFNQSGNKEPVLAKESYNSYGEMIGEAKKWSDEYNNTSNIHLPNNISDLDTDVDFFSYSKSNTGNSAEVIGKIYVVVLKRNAALIKIIYQPLQNDYYIRAGIYNSDIDYDDSKTINSITVSFKQFDGVIKGYFSDESGEYFIQYNSMNKEDFVAYLYELFDFN